MKTEPQEKEDEKSDESEKRTVTAILDMMETLLMADRLIDRLKSENTALKFLSLMLTVILLINISISWLNH